MSWQAGLLLARRRHATRQRMTKGGAGKSRCFASVSPLRVPSERVEKSLEPDSLQGFEITGVGDAQGVQIARPRGGIQRRSFDMGRRKFIQERGRQHAADTAVEIPERMNPLKSPVRPGEHVNECAGRPLKPPQSFREIITELPHEDRHFIERRRGVGTDLHVHIAKPSRPIREEMTGQPFMPQAEPFGCDRDLVRARLENLARIAASGTASRSDNSVYERRPSAVSV
jgi:hypothetical protein